MKLEINTLKILEKALYRLESGFEALPNIEHKYDAKRIEEVILEVSEVMKNNYPYFHPFYAGQMLKPPHPIARVAYMLSLWINPNNHALDGGRASSHLEKEAVAEIANLIGWDNFLGHLTGGGTMANMEALWISRQLKPGMKVVASEQAHYTHKRISHVLDINYQSIPCDEKARIDINSLKRILDSGEVGTVVATIGTTGTGSVDPLAEIIALKEQYKFRLHADAAYGGYFILANNLNPNTQRVYDCLNEVDSVVIDPHKHGLQPYGCGCILYSDPGVGKFLVPEGEFAQGLIKSRKAALALYEKIVCDERFKTILPPELDILVWAPNGSSASQISRRTEDIFHAAAKENIHFATFQYPSYLLQTNWTDVIFDQQSVTCLRSCLMKPEHHDWAERIWKIFDKVANIYIH
jgi:hypothetical protein